MSKQEICPHDLCTGCAACMNVCPKNAITMQEDHLGFIHPVIDPNLCIDCNLCDKTCPVNNPLDLTPPQKTYAAISVDDVERSSSSSGGAASVFSRWIVEHGGIVYGCSQTDYKRIQHIRVDNPADIALLKGSKYVQSNINIILRDVRKDLREGRKVLFIGTPCQIAGLKNFLRKDYDNLFTADLICHGVPSQKMLREDVEEGKLFDTDKDAIDVNFRWKSPKGIQFGIQYHKHSDSEMLYSKSLPYDPYILAFHLGLSFRENCHSCPYSQPNRIGDITIGDFWRLGAVEPTKFKIKKGVSLILVNTPKGASLKNSLSSHFIVEKRTLSEALAGNDNLRRPSPRPSQKDLFLDIYAKQGLREACRISVSDFQYRKIAFFEFLQRQQGLMKVLKKCRYILNTLKR